MSESTKLLDEKAANASTSPDTQAAEKAALVTELLAGEVAYPINTPIRPNNAIVTKIITNNPDPASGSIELVMHVKISTASGIVGPVATLPGGSDYAIVPAGTTAHNGHDAVQFSIGFGFQSHVNVSILAEEQTARNLKKGNSGG